MRGEEGRERKGKEERGREEEERTRETEIERQRDRGRERILYVFPVLLTLLECTLSSPHRTPVSDNIRRWLGAPVFET